jgi:hypothetical protein
MLTQLFVRPVVLLLERADVLDRGVRGELAKRALFDRRALVLREARLGL